MTWLKLNSIFFCLIINHPWCETCQDKSTNSQVCKSINHASLQSAHWIFGCWSCKGWSMPSESYVDYLIVHWSLYASLGSGFVCIHLCSRCLHDVWKCLLGDIFVEMDGVFSCNPLKAIALEPCRRYFCDNCSARENPHYKRHSSTLRWVLLEPIFHGNMNLILTQVEVKLIPNNSIWTVFRRPSRLILLVSRRKPMTFAPGARQILCLRNGHNDKERQRPWRPVK